MDGMSLKILLPFRVFLEIKNVERVLIETGKGSYGFLPNRLDCVAALVPGVLVYETEKKEMQYVAIDEGILIKADKEVVVSVRNAIDGVNLGRLQEIIKEQYNSLGEREKEVRVVVKKMESGFIQQLEKFQKS